MMSTSQQNLVYLLIGTAVESGTQNALVLLAMNHNEFGREQRAVVEFLISEAAQYG